ncbi:AsnC family transcriptional regulator [Varunaivibrio sulfuroxidans]|uniref:siroheme decarboxylase n=1 Tax=Varunaivibrio sulfuroxidans TaxID=1773489 RepID=A0A4R3J7E2_9PROT|nr:AsnC family transcriptional regulator [Varunaivibrio sulfuroxidans]TCS61788.1 AsnC family transcriptional regulator [Varunaivibrio sulfuroxidans]WES32029.1 AsnC family transcriptional regulator [Varunaivibrio sulfuroxidans]
MDTIDKRLLNEFQHDFPLTPRPYAVIAERLGVDERTVVAAYDALIDGDFISRIGAVVRTGAVGASTLAAMAVPPRRLESVAAFVSAFDEVNHNYQRDHAYNLWFVITAPSRARLERVIAAIENETQLAILDLPMIEDYHLDLGFDLKWT